MAARSVPTMPAWLAGQKMTATLMNQISAFGNFWANPPSFSMYQAVAQSVPNATPTQITMDTVDWDSDSGRAVGTPWSYTIPAGMSGRWRFTCAISWTSSGTTQHETQLYVNGVQSNGAMWNSAPPSSGNGAIGGTKSIKVNAGDVVSVWGLQNTGGAALTIAASGQFSFFAGVLESLATP